jgi:hypothetical protein
MVQASDPSAIEVSLRDDCIDKWTVKFIYPENKCVILDFEFHLVENLPPKVTVVFPSAIQYVCFEELGGKSWTSNSDIPTLIFALQQEYLGRSAVFEETKKLAEIDAEKQWKFVQGAHKDWDYVDITELTSKLSSLEIEQWRKEGKEAISAELTHQAPTVSADASVPAEAPKEVAVEAPQPPQEIVPLEPSPRDILVEAPQEVVPVEAPQEVVPAPLPPVEIAPLEPVPSPRETPVPDEDGQVQELQKIIEKDIASLVLLADIAPLPVLKVRAVPLPALVDASVPEQ